MRFCALAFLFGAAMSAAHSAASSTVSVAAAANLVYVLAPLEAEFKRNTPHVALSTTTGASGSLFAQIRNGAPFDVFLSADVEYPQRAIDDGLAERASLRIFATGRLVLWTMRDALDLTDLAQLVRTRRVQKLAIPQPQTAPYGRAAKVVLDRLGLGSATANVIVFGESVSQTAQFVETGNADLGFVAQSLVESPRLKNKGHWQLIDPQLYREVSLDHGAVLTLRGTKNPTARAFLDFLASEPARKILREYGYDVRP